MPVGQTRSSLKTAFKKVRSLGPLHTSGPIAITPDGSRIVTCVEEHVLLTDLETGNEICKFLGDSQTIHSLCVSPSGTHLITFSASLSLRLYEISSSKLTSNKRIQPLRTIARAHDSPVHVCRVDPTSTYLASGSADGVVKVWDIHRGFVTHVFKGHGGVVSALTFHFPKDPSSLETPPMRLITASVDTHIRIFNLTSDASTLSMDGKPEAVLEGHVSVPRGLDVSGDGRWLISAGRDSVALIWDLSAKAPSRQNKKKAGTPSMRPDIAKTIPILERVEAVGFLPPEQNLPVAVGNKESLQFFTGGSKGIIQIWDSQRGEVLWRSGKGKELETADDQEEQRQITDVLYVPLTSTLVSVHADQNILCYFLPSMKLARQLIGYNDEIIDATFLHEDSPNSYLALATNSSLIRLYATKTFDARLLEGHAEIVLALTSSADSKLLVSGSKDKTARIWASSMSEHSTDFGYFCIGLCEGHADSVGAIAMPRRRSDEAEPLSFMFTGSQDRTIKMWDLIVLQDRLNDVSAQKATRCHSLTTFKAHDKDINSLDVAPNNRLLVSGSQDRTAKIYEIIYSPGSKSSAARGELKVLGTCKGHKRGVWTVKFSPTDRLVATGSGDKTVKLWNLDDFSCIKTFEGHTNSVLRVDFLTGGLQLVTSASDGLVKVWNVHDEECVTTLDNHEDKVWALAISADQRTIVSGAADSVVTFWEDSTEAEAAGQESKRAEMIVKDQDFLNYVALRDYRKALELALAMNQPGRLFTLFKDISVSDSKEFSEETYTGNILVDEVIQTLAPSDLARLLLFVRNWNSNAKTSDVAQRVLFAIVKLRSADDVIRIFEDGVAAESFVDAEDSFPTAGKPEITATKELIEAIIPYTERHLSKVDRLLQESYVIDYILGEMDDGMFDAGNPDMMEVEAY